MGSRMPSGQAKEDATRRGIIERSTPRKVRQTQEPIGTRRHVGGIMRHNRICIGATVVLGLHGITIQPWRSHDVSAPAVLVPAQIL